MTFVDPIGDMITRIRNAQMRMLNNVIIPGSKFREKILDVLKQEGYIADYKVLSDSNNKDRLSVDLKYNNGLPVITEIKRLSKPGRRIYVRATSIPKIEVILSLNILRRQVNGLLVTIQMHTPRKIIRMKRSLGFSTTTREML